MRVLIVDDDPSFRFMLAQIVSDHMGNVVGEAENGKEAIEASERLHPDLVLMDVSMPVMGGLSAARHLHASQPGVSLIFVSQHCDRAYLEEAINCGASGYVVKRAAATELPLAIESVKAGQLFRSSLIK